MTNKIIINVEDVGFKLNIQRLLRDVKNLTDKLILKKQSQNMIKAL